MKNTKRIIYAGFLIACGVILPIIFHIMPISIGPFFLPIHYSAYFAGGFFGPLVGAIVGLLTPLISHQLTSMPPNPVVIYIALETLTYGLIFGLLFYKKHFNIYLSLLIAMFCGRLANIFGNYLVAEVFLANISKPFILLNVLKNFSQGLVGAVIQMLIIPVVIKRVNTAFNFINIEKEEDHMKFNYLEPDKTCVLLLDNIVIYESKDNGVKPLVNYLYHNGIPQQDTILIDKVIGLAVANLVVYCGLKTVYGKTVSQPALELLKKHKVNVFYEVLVPNILRKDKTDICPLEKYVSTLVSPEAVYMGLVEIVINNNPLHLK